MPLRAAHNYFVPLYRALVYVQRTPKRYIVIQLTLTLTRPGFKISLKIVRLTWRNIEKLISRIT